MATRDYFRATDDLLALENQVCFAVAVAARNVVALYRPILEPLGLTHPQYLVMLALWQHGSRSVGQLGDLLQLDSATISPLVKRLESDGLVTRRRSRSDERVLEVAPTQKGAALRERATLVPGTVIERLGIDIAALEDLRASLTRFSTAASTAATTATAAARPRPSTHPRSTRPPAADAPKARSSFRSSAETAR
ncbi:MAG: MarR family transcriptional regulator [Burkholderiaceae bacterium]|nr:MarR family transcriptional regulator [Microbacteriaceae bacterium]